MTPTFEQIAAAVGYTPEQLRARDRHKTIADARRLACTLLYRHAGLPMYEIADLIQRSYGAVYYAIQSWQANHEVDRHVRELTHDAITKLHTMTRAAA